MNVRLRAVAWLTSAVLAALSLPATAGAPGHGPDDLGVGAPALVWGGQVWIPRVSVTQQRPYTNYWNASPNAIYVDTKDRLHIWIRKVNDLWTAAEIRSAKMDYGYGTYTFVVETPIDTMDPNEVLGLFTRNNLPPPGDGALGGSAGSGNKDPRYVNHAETDFEMGKWNWKARGYDFNAQYVVQPWWEKGRIKHLKLPSKIPYTAQFVWGPTTTKFSVWRGATTEGTPVSAWTSKFSNGVPHEGTTVCLEAWLIYSRGAARGRDQEVVIDSFDYTPAP
jgi:hypothetical protein